MAVLTYRVDSLADRAVPLSQANASMLQALTNAETGIRGYQQTDNRSFLQPYDLGVTEYPRALRRAESLVGNDPHLDALLAQEARAGSAWLHGFAMPIAAHQATSTGLAAPLRGKTLLNRFRVANSAVATLVAGEISATKSAAKDDGVAAAIIVAMLLALAIGSGTLFGRSVVRRLIPPIERAVAAIRSLSVGDVPDILEPGGTVETRTLAQAFNVLGQETIRRQVASQRRTRLRRLVASIGRNVSEELELVEVAQRTVVALGTTFEVGRVFIRVAGATELRPAIAEWQAPGLSPSLSTGRAPLALLEALDTLPVDQGCQDAMAMLDALGADHPEVSAYLERLGARGYLICPLVIAGRVVGRISLIQVDRAAGWPRETLELIDQVAVDVARAVNHAILFRREQQVARELRDLDRAKDAFVGTVSHELRTPLTSIRGYLEIVRDGEAGELPAQASRMLEVVDRNAERLQSLVENLLTLSKAATGELVRPSEAIRAATLLTSACNVISPVAGRAGVTVTLHDETPDVVVHGDAEQLERALLNVLTNAVKFTPKGGSVIVRAAIEGTRLAVSVADTGIGIPPEDLDRLGARFFRASNATAQAISGTGLGLSIVSAILDQHGGTFELSSEEGEGTVVRLLLPLFDTRAGEGSSVEPVAT